MHVFCGSERAYEFHNGKSKDDGQGGMRCDSNTNQTVSRLGREQAFPFSALEVGRIVIRGKGGAS